MQYQNPYNKSINAFDDIRNTKIWEKLNKLNPVKANQAYEFIKYVTPYTKKISNYFPGYKRFDYNHVYRLVQRMGDIIKSDLLCDDGFGLQEDEIFCLIISAYIHNIGLTLFETGKKQEELLLKLNLTDNFEITDPILINYLKQKRIERAIDFLKYSDAEQFVPKNLYCLIEALIKGHSVPVKNLDKDLTNKMAVGNIETDPGALSVILSCADILEFSDTKVLDVASEEANYRGDEIAKIAITEIRKNDDIVRNMAINNNGLIIVSDRVDRAEVCHAIHMILNQIEKWLLEYIEKARHLRRRFPCGVLKINSHLINRDNITTTGFEYLPVGIKIDKEQLKNLLSSNNLWNKPWLPLKELLQNSVDACRYRNFVKLKSEEYEPKIDIIVDTKNREITVNDNGCGMDKNDITNYFLHIGKSKTRSSIFRNDPLNKKFQPIARFGLGFWSVFVIAEKVSIKTKLFGYDKNNIGYKFDVTMEPVMSYLELIKDKKLPSGTSITLKIRDNIDLLGLIDHLNNNIITSPPVPVFIKNEEGEVMQQFPVELPDITLEHFFSYRSTEAKKSGINCFNFSFDNENIEVKLAIVYSIIDGNVSCLTPQGKPMFYFKPFHRYFTVSMCGFETKIDFNFPVYPFPFAVDRVGIVIVKIKSPGGLDFTFYREKIQENNRLKEIINDIHKAIAQGLENFYKKIKALGNPKKIGTLVLESRTNGGEAGDWRYPGLYNIYKTYYASMTVIYLWKWKRLNNTVTYEKKYLFIEDFWKLDKPVIYIVIWPSLFLYGPEKEEQIVRYWASNEIEEGYLLLASYEASAIIDVAKKILVRTAKQPYSDAWNRETEQYIVIEPEYGYSQDNRWLFNINLKSVSKCEFEECPNKVPWLVFGRDRFFLDANHKLTDKIIQFYSEGHIEIVRKILELMASSNKLFHKEIEKITGITIFDEKFVPNKLSINQDFISKLLQIEQEKEIDIDEKIPESSLEIATIDFPENKNIFDTQLPSVTVKNASNSFSSKQSMKHCETDKKLDPIDNFEKFKTKLKNCPPGRKYFSEFEKIGIEILTYLFKNDLGKAKPQKTTLDRTQRRDVIFRNKKKSEFFKRIADKFDADSIIVDFKNYKKPIGNKVITDVSKYSNKALGRFILIISPEGGGKTAIKSQIRIYRDQDILILILSNRQILKMVSVKEKEGEPAELLNDLLDDLLDAY